MTDPQNDKPCRDCKRPTQHVTERCDDCRTPAGQLVTALREIAPQIEDVTQDGESVVSIGCLTIEIDDDGCWSINGHEDDGVTIARAAAAVVDHAGTIASLAAERDTLAAEVKRLREEVFSAGPWVESEVYRGEWLRKRDGDAIAMTIPGGNGWVARLPGGDKRGPETSDAGRHAADLALLAAGYRLVGGVHPLPDEVRS